MKKKIRMEINQTCRLNAVKYSYRMSLIFLMIAFLIQAILHISVNAIFLLIAGVLLPCIIDAIQNSQGKKEESFYLVHLQKKYGYTNRKYRQYVYSFSVLMILLVIWQISFWNSKIESQMIRALPGILLVLMIGMRVVIFLFYYLYLPYKVEFNR